MLYYTGGKIQSSAADFWGAAYDPEDNALPWQFPLSVLMPTGGMMMSPALTQCPDELVPLLPMRQADEDTVEVLCGLLSDNYVVSLSRNDIDNDEVWDAIIAADE